MKLFVMLIGLCFALSSYSANTRIKSFKRSKKTLNKLYKSMPRTTFYCGCSFEGKKIDWKSCGYSPKKNAKRAARLEWEHVVPASLFGRNLDSWRKGHSKCRKKNGKPFKRRKCATRVNEKFRLMAADMYNLRPSIGEINAERSNFSFGVIDGEKRQFGKCDFEVSGKIVEPSPDVRGDIARVYLYMDSTYPGFGIVSDRNKAIFSSWDKTDPVSKEECKYASNVLKIQGNENKVLTERCKGLAK